MSIVYTLICKGTDKILSEYTEYQGNFEQISRNLLLKVKPETRSTFNYADEYFFHYINFSGVTYMCMCDSMLNQDTAFSYLEDIKTLFLDTFTIKQIESAISYSFNDRFNEGIKSKMIYYNANLNESDSVTRLKRGLIEYKDNILLANDILMERGEKINMIVKKADNLRTESKNYYTKSKKVKKTSNWRNYVIIFFSILIGLLLIYLISALACGWDFSKC